MPTLATAFLAAILLIAPGVHAQDAISATEKAQTIVHLLDYVSVDYPEFVKEGKVLDQPEYAEQREFATQSIALLGQLPAVPEKDGLIAKARQLLARVDAKADGTEVSALANSVRADVIRIYKLTVAPRAAPDMARAASLYTANCASCHGASGKGDGPLAKGMDPSPSNFHEAGRMGQRSIYGLYNTIALGVKGTPMRGFTELSEADRWTLAFFAAGIRSTPADVDRGQELWKQGLGKADFTGFKALVTATPGETAARNPQLASVQAYLTAQPQAIAAAAPAPLELTRRKLAESLDAVKRGDREASRQHAITAYLEGFELIEASLDNVDAPLRTETEREMMALRTAISGGTPAGDIAAQIARIEALLDRVDQKLDSGGLAPATAFISSLLILLREGLEAILVLAAITAFVKKTGRKDAMPYIHAGWMGAVALGAVTWFVATYVIGISGANREMTEGVTALVAAAMLLYVGWWLHGKSFAQAWSTFIRDQVTSALGRRTLWAMAGVSFLAVYRELFEIVLFYQTLWVQAGQGGRIAVLAGMGAAAVLLALIGGAILKYSVRLPIGPFFAWTSGLLALMAVVFVGNGVAALQEAGVIESTLVKFVTVPLLGIHSTAQGLALQVLAVALVAAGVLSNRRKSMRAGLGAP